MTYTVDIKDNEILNEFKKEVAENGKTESEMILKLMENYLRQQENMRNAMEIVNQKILQHKDVLIRLRDK